MAAAARPALTTNKSMVLAARVRVLTRVPRGHVGGDDGGVETLGELGGGEGVRADLKVANDDEGKGLSAGVGADGGKEAEVVGA